VDDYADSMFPGVGTAVLDFFGKIGGKSSLHQPWGTDHHRTTHCVLKKL